MSCALHAAEAVRCFMCTTTRCAVHAAGWGCCLICTVRAVPDENAIAPPCNLFDVCLGLLSTSTGEAGRQKEAGARSELPAA
eukprot:1046647-Pelagomonas_calceolata.AAC.3